MPHSPFLFFLRCLILSGFNYKREKAVIHDLLHKFSYRYSQLESQSIKAPLRYLKKSIKLLLTTKKSKTRAVSDYFVLDMAAVFLEKDKRYLEGISKEQYSFLFRDDCENELSTFHKLYYLIQLFLVAAIIFPIALFCKDRSRKSLILLELTETLLLGQLLKKGACKKIIIFSAFEKNTTFLSFFFKKKLHIHVSLIPSSNPIVYFYQNVICDTFIFTSPFHAKEFEKLKDKWFVTDTKLWPPFEYYSIKLNRGQDNSGENKFAIGFVSHGSALREHLNHPDPTAERESNAEKALLNCLKTMADEINLIIYLHPLEKKTEKNLEFAKNYYKNLFGKNITYSPIHEASKENFNLCSIAVSGFSSAQIERLYAGHKTLFAPMGFLDNYYSDSRLDAISVKSCKELKAKIEEFKNLSDDVFFEKYNLKEYRWDFYPLLN